MKNKLEKKIATRAHREKIQENITLVIARLTAQSGRMLFVPDAVLVKRLGIQGVKGRNPAYRIRDSFTRLKKKGLVEFKKTQKGWSAQLTRAGKEYAQTLEMLDRIDIDKPKKWDERWRVVIFDIWERRRATRDKLRRMLQKAGFSRVQNSVWVHPYDCEELVAFLRTEMRLGSSVLYMIVEGLEGDDKLRNHFGLR